MTGVWDDILSADLNSWRCVGERMYLARVLEHIKHFGDFDIPSRRVVFEVLALSLEHTTFNINCRRMIFPSICDARQRSDRCSRVNHLLAVRNEAVPFVIFWHSQRPFLELLGRLEGFIRFSLQDTGIGIICFLDFSNNDGLQLPSGRL